MNETELKQVAMLFNKTADVLGKMVNKMIALEARIAYLEEKISKLTITGIQP